MGILAVDDDPNTVELLRMLLSEEGYVTWAVQTPEDALSVAEQETVELIILDVVMPRVDGFELFKQLRQIGCDCPVIFLSARTETQSKVAGLRLGADDYLAKPFEASELLARVEAVMRRCQREPAASPAAPVPAGTLLLDITRQKAFLPGGKEITLAPTEMKILQCLMANSGTVVTRETLADTLWGVNDQYTSVQVNAYICRLRKKVEQDPFRPTLIKTVRGTGYLLTTNGR